MTGTDAGVGGDVSVHRGVIMYRVGGREYPMRTAPNCPVCVSENRLAMERAILRGVAYTAVARSLPVGRGTKITPSVVRSHAKEHMPQDFALRTILLEERAAEIGRDVEAIEDTMVDQIGFLKVVVHDAFAEMAESGKAPTISQGIAAARILASLGLHAGSEVDAALWEEAVEVMMAEAHEIMPPDLFEEWGQRLLANPILRSIQRKMSGDLLDDDLEDSGIYAELPSP
jgi:hypothetical protein